MRKTIFYNSNPIVISTRLNEYMKSNFGYEIESDLQSLREAKVALEEKKKSMRSDYQDRAYIENMLMLETVRVLLKAHVAEATKTDEGKYKNDAQRKAVHAAKAEKTNEDMDKDLFKKKAGIKTDYKGPGSIVEPNPDTKDVGDGPNPRWTKKPMMFKKNKNAPKMKRTDAYHTTEDVDAEWAKVKASKNQIKINQFLAGLDQATAKRLTGDKAQTTNIVKGRPIKNTSRKPADPYTHDTNPLYTESETPKFDTNTTKYDNSYEAPKEYKMKKEKLEEGLLAQLNALLEGDAAEAEITMAARGIVDELQDMIEKLGKIQNDQLGPLTDEMSYSHGPEVAASFKSSVDGAVASLLDNARSAKDAVNDAVLVLSGEAPASDMTATDAELGGDMADDMESDIESDIMGGDESMSGPEDEPLGRAKR